MESGLAHQMVYGDGKGQNITHYYAGAKPDIKKSLRSKRKKKKTLKNK
jgi:hypothetical protein